MSQTVNYPLPVVGIDMLSSETSMPNGAVRSAVNVDIERNGVFSRRAGYEQRIHMPGLHSLYYAAQSDIILVADNDQLCTVDHDLQTLTWLTALGSPDPLSYTEYNGNIYYVNKTTTGWIPSGRYGVCSLGLPTPTPPSRLEEAPGGLLPGTYAVAISMFDSLGEESGLSAVKTIDLPVGGGIRLYGLPVEPGYSLGIYITPPDGDRLMCASVAPAAFPVYDIVEYMRGAPARTQFLEPLPPGDIIRWHNGRLFVASGSNLFFSEALRPHLHRPGHSVIPFRGDITMVESVGSGIFVGDERGVWFLRGGDPNDFNQQLVSPTPVVAGSSLVLPAEYFPEQQTRTEGLCAVWLCSDGYAIGTSGGNTLEPQRERIRIPNGLHGKSAFLMRKGRKQVITLVDKAPTAVGEVATDSTIP